MASCDPNRKELSLRSPSRPGPKGESQQEMVLAASSASYPKHLISPRFSVKASSSPVHLKPSQLPLIAEVKSRLLTGAYRLEPFPCPCGEATGVIVSEVDRYGLPLTFVLCSVCGTVRIDPYLDASSLEDFYTCFYQEMYARATDVDTYFSKQRSYGEKVLAVSKASLKPGSWIYEIGCGAGGALEVFQQLGFQVAGCDYSAELIESGRLRGIRNIFHGSLKDIQTKVNVAKADLIYLHHVFEHVNHPLEFLKECRKHLAPGGRIIIIIPDLQGIDSFIYPAGDLLQVLHIAHKYNFSLAGLRRLGNQGGYQMRRLSPDPKIETPCSHSPEIWLELVVDKIATRSESKSTPAADDGHGHKMLQYLRRTERLYSLGLCRGQFLRRFGAGKNFIATNVLRISRRTPTKVIPKLK